MYLIILILILSKINGIRNLSHDILSSNLVPFLNNQELYRLSLCDSELHQMSIPIIHKRSQQLLYDQLKQISSHSLISLETNKLQYNQAEFISKLHVVMGLHEILFNSTQTEIDYYIKLFIIDSKMTVAVLLRIVSHYEQLESVDLIQSHAKLINGLKQFIVGNDFYFDLQQKLNHFLINNTNWYQ